MSGILMVTPAGPDPLAGKPYEDIMNSIPNASKTLAMFALQCFFGRPFHSSSFPRYFPLFIFVLLMTILVAGSASAQQDFFLIGAWEHTEAAAQNTPAFTITQYFNQDGTFSVQEMIAPRPGMVGTIVKYWGNYRVTGGASISYQTQDFQMCGSGSDCLTCPGYPQACQMARQLGAEPGVQYKSSFQIQGQNQFTDQGGQIWRRIR
jgi:hypothetical protein